MKVLLMLMGGLLLVASVSWSRAGKVDPDTVDLSSYRWRHRLLLIFTPTDDLPAFQALLQQLNQERAGISDRDLIVFRLVSRGRSQVDKAELSPQGAEILRRRFGVSENEFRVVLLGKDGGVKLSEQAVHLAEIFGLIDSMPMRQQEMQQKRR